LSEYHALSTGEVFDAIAPLFLWAPVLAWIFIFKPGQLLFSYLGRKGYELSLPWSLLAGLWLCTAYCFLLGMLGLFSIPALLLTGGALLALGHARGLPLFPWSAGARPPKARRYDPFVTGSCVLVAVLIMLVHLGHPAAWCDGNYLGGAGNLAKTGKLLIGICEGQFGMSILTAMISLVFTHLTPLNTAIAWTPFHAVLLLFGFYYLLQELFPGKSWGLSAILIFLLPIAFKIPESRGSVVGFSLALWVVFFTLRAQRTRRTEDRLGAIFALASAWNFGQMGAIYAFAILGFWSLVELLEGRRERFREIWQILFWTNVIEWPILVASFRWILGPEKPLWLAFAPETVTLALAWALKRLNTWNRPPLKLPSYSKVVPIAAVAILAYIDNPSSSPQYGWFYFSRYMSFLGMNFSSYGLLGYLFALSLLLALYDREVKTRVPRFVLLLGFFASCLMQLAAAHVLEKGVNPLGLRPYGWDIWKDSTLYWNDFLILIGLVYLADYAVERSKAFKKNFKRRQLITAVSVLALFSLQSFKPYTTLLHQLGTMHFDANAFADAHLSDDVMFSWFGQQTYSLPAYVTYALGWGSPSMASGTPVRLASCSNCSIHVFDGGEARPLVDYLVDAPIGQDETLLATDSVLNDAVYLNRQVRYASGANTVCPVYLHYYDIATLHEFFWKDHCRIRRNGNGMAYTITDPAKNLIWLYPKNTPDGGLTADLTVSDTADYELYRGSEFSPELTPVTIDGRAAVQTGETNGLDLSMVEGGKGHTLVMPPPEGKRLDPSVPVVVYPKRYWFLEKYILESSGISNIDSINLTRATGIPSAPITIENMIRLATTEDAAERHALLDRYRVRYLIVDPLFRAVFPQGESHFDADPSLTRRTAGTSTVYEYRGKTST
jgi:hypothetical protein